MALSLIELQTLPVNPQKWQQVVAQSYGFSSNGSFVSPYSFVLTKNIVGGVTYYYANNAFQSIYGGAGSAGGVDGSDCDAVFAAVKANVIAVGGGSIYLTPGTYPLANTFEVDTQFPSLNIIGAGRSTILAYSGTSACIKFSAEAETCLLSNFKIILSGAGSCGVLLDHGQKNKFDNIDIEGTGNTDGRTGIIVSGESHWNKFYDCSVHNIQNCYHWRYVSEAGVGYPIRNMAYDCIARDCGNGWKIESTDNLFDAITCENFNGVGIDLGAAGAGGWNEFNKPYIEGGGLEEAGSIAIRINVAAGSETFVSPVYNMVVGTKLVNNGGTHSRWVGPNYQNGWYVADCVNGTVFNHGLAGTPSSVHLTLLTGTDFLSASKNIIVFASAISSTQITVGMQWSDGSLVTSRPAPYTGGYTVYVYAEYQP